MIKQVVKTLFEGLTKDVRSFCFMHLHDANDKKLIYEYLEELETLNKKYLYKFKS